MDFTLRPWQQSDLENLVRFANNPDIANNMSNKFVYPYTELEGKRFLEITYSRSPTNILAIDISGIACGAIGIHQLNDIYSKNAEIGYWLAQEFWGHGIMTKALIQMLDYSFSNWDINRIFGRAFGTNIASQRVLEKAGFIFEVKFDKTIFKNNKYYDEIVYGLTKEDFQKNNKGKLSSDIL